MNYKKYVYKIEQNVITIEQFIRRYHFEDKDKELYQEIVKAYQSEKTKEIYKNDFHGQYIPAWDR